MTTKSDTSTTPHWAMTIARDADVWLTVPEAAARARCGPKVIYRAIESGKLKAATVNARKDRRIRPAAVDAWLESSIGV